MIDLAAIDDSRRLLLQFAAQFDAPAYVRRAREVERAWAALLAACRRQREQWLDAIRWRLPPVIAAAAEPALTSSFSDRSLAAITALQAAVGLPRRAGATPGRSALRRQLRSLRASVERFNRRWLQFLESVDLAAINRLRDDYNRYYLLEKECAVGSAQLAALTFQKLAPLTTADVLEHFPALPIP